MMKWPWLLLTLLFSFSVFASQKLEFFYNNDCLKCDHARAALLAYQGQHPELEIVGIDVNQSKENLNRLRYLGLKEQLPTLDIPAFYFHSELKAGMGDPSELITWLDKTRANSINLPTEKSPTLLSVTLGAKDFVLSFWGLCLILFSIALSVLAKRLDGIISALVFSFGAIISSILWTYPTTRILFGQYFMFDLLAVGILGLLGLAFVVKQKKYTLSGWSELSYFGLGFFIQRLCSLYSGFDFLRLQDILLETGVAMQKQQGMNILYGLIQFFLMGLVIFTLNLMKKR